MPKHKTPDIAGGFLKKVSRHCVFLFFIFIFTRSAWEKLNVHRNKTIIILRSIL